MGLPAIRARGLPGNRDEPYRDGIKAIIDIIYTTEYVAHALSDSQAVTLLILTLESFIFPDNSSKMYFAIFSDEGLISVKHSISFKNLWSSLSMISFVMLFQDLEVDKHSASSSFSPFTNISIFPLWP
jgi:hypothetical protein